MAFYVSLHATPQVRPPAPPLLSPRFHLHARRRDATWILIQAACIPVDTQSGWVFPLLLLIGGIATTVSRRDKVGSADQGQL